MCCNQQGTPERVQKENIKSEEGQRASVEASFGSKGSSGVSSQSLDPTPASLTELLLTRRASGNSRATHFTALGFLVLEAGHHMSPPPYQLACQPQLATPAPLLAFGKEEGDRVEVWRRAVGLRVHFLV